MAARGPSTVTRNNAIVPHLSLGFYRSEDASAKRRTLEYFEGLSSFLYVCGAGYAVSFFRDLSYPIVTAKSHEVQASRSFTVRLRRCS
jgi:hypothetical protein